MTVDADTYYAFAPLRFLIKGPPKIGKTVAVQRLVALLAEQGVAVSGFLTHEVRERGRRVGFVVRDLAGPEAMLAHQDFQTEVQVGRFGVDVLAFERVALPALRRVQDSSAVVVIDELGRMELASEAFIDAVDNVLTTSVPVVATVHVHAHPVTDALQQRADVQRIIVTEGNRDELPQRLFEQFMHSAFQADRNSPPGHDSSRARHE